MERLGIRELRNQTAAAVRRAGSGERIVITVDGRPVAQLGPLDPVGGEPTLEDLAARGLLSLPPRPDRPSPSVVVELWAGARLDRLFRRAATVNGDAMTIALDTTALVARFLDAPERAVVLEAMAADGDWCATRAGPHRGAAGPARPPHRRPAGTRRAAPGVPRRLGALRHGARRPGLPRPRRRAGPQPAAADRRRRCTSRPPTDSPGR